MSASDNWSTKCSGLLLRSSFAILAARARHLFSAASHRPDSAGPTACLCHHWMAELLRQFSGVLHFLTRAVASITLRSS
jgi:hypothetical protein